MLAPSSSTAEKQHHDSRAFEGARVEGATHHDSRALKGAPFSPARQTPRSGGYARRRSRGGVLSFVTAAAAMVALMLACLRAEARLFIPSV
jgi:hypothetical protein